MTRSISNAFTRAAPGGRRSSGVERIAPMRATLRQMHSDWILNLTPMRTIDTLDTWRGYEGKAGGTLLFDVQPRRAIRPSTSRASLGALAAKLRVWHQSLDARHIVLRDSSLAAIVSRIDSVALRMVRIDGPIEELDAVFINRAIAIDESPLTADLRATAAIQVLSDERIELHVRKRDDALAMISHNFRQYLAAMCDEPPAQFAGPDVRQLDGLLRISGHITVRPVETVALPTSIDIGVSTTPEDSDGPARQSLIYDRPSNSWHGGV